MEQSKNQNQTSISNPATVNPLEVPVMKPEAALQTQASKTISCRYCKFPVKDNFYFCPNCGKNLKQTPFKFSFLKTIGLIIFSILFPPLGLIPGFKYLRRKEASARIIGLILIIISIITTIAVALFLVQMYNDMTKFYVDLYSQQGGKATYEGVTPENVYKQLNSLQQISR